MCLFFLGLTVLTLVSRRCFTLYFKLFVASYSYRWRVCILSHLDLLRNYTIPDEHHHITRLNRVVDTDGVLVVLYSAPTASGCEQCKVLHSQLSYNFGCVLYCVSATRLLSLEHSQGRLGGLIPSGHFNSPESSGLLPSVMLSSSLPDGQTIPDSLLRTHFTNAQDKVVIITGGANGLGRQAGKEFARAG